MSSIESPALRTRAARLSLRAKIETLPIERDCNMAENCISSSKIRDAIREHNFYTYVIFHFFRLQDCGTAGALVLYPLHQIYFFLFCLSFKLISFEMFFVTFLF